MNTDNPQVLPDRISSDLSTQIEKAFTEHMSHDAFRVKVKEVINDHTDTVGFMKKVQEYAREEIERQTFKNVRFLLSIIVVPIGLTIITAIIIHSLGLK